MCLSTIQNGCRVGFFGLGKSSAALLEYLPLDKCKITLRSDKDISWSAIPCGARIERIFAGESALQSIDEDVILFSPSVRRDRPELEEAKRRGVIFTSDAELFFHYLTKPLFAITGSDGKSTTSTLVSRLLASAGINNRLVGNIGQPMLPTINRADAYVAELSSFMLFYGKPRARRGCITNITPNHLDWHKNFEEYKNSKISLAKCCEEMVISDDLCQISGAYAIVSTERNYSELKAYYKAEIYLTLENGYILKNGIPTVDISLVKRNEKHNIKNAMMAIAMTDGYVGNKQISEVLTDFEGLPHRCEKIISYEGVDFFDSSIDSTPKRTAITLESLNRKVAIILGGRSKNLDYKDLISPLKKYAEKVIISGENSKEIFEAIHNEVDSVIIPEFEEAVKQGAEYAKDIGALLLSPASTSYDLFNNYTEKGSRFKEIILKMKT